MARRARGTSADREQEMQILEALRFVSLAQKDEGTPYQTHCRFTGSEVIAFDGTLAAGHPCAEIAGACPHTLKLIAALSRMRGAYSMTMLDGETLVLNSDKFRAVVPALRVNDIETVIGHPNGYALSNAWLVAAEKAGMFITEAAETVLESSIYTQEYSIIGTDRQVFIEAATQNHTPPGLIIPWTCIKAMKKIEHKLIGFGFDELAITFHYENGAWLRTQLFISEGHPKLGQFASKFDGMNVTPKPDELERAVNAVLPFSNKASGVWVSNNSVRSQADPNVNVGATYRMEGLPFEASFNGAQFLKVAGIITGLDFTTDKNMIMFSGDLVRGGFTRMAS